MNRLLLTILSLFFTVNLYAAKFSIRGTINFKNSILANRVNDYIVSKSNLVWVSKTNESKTRVYTVGGGTTPVSYILNIENFIVNLEKDRNGIKNKVKKFLSNNSKKIIGYHIQIISCPHDERPGRPSKIIRSYKK